MHKFILGLLRSYIKFGFFFYYRRFKVSGKEYIPKQGSVLFLPNHRNMLIDPLVVAVSTSRFMTFLTRSDVFVKGIIDKALRYLGLLPIYRLRDGYSSLKKNQSVFDISAQRLIEENGTVLIFPEGSSSTVQRVRPLSKGFTRLVFHAIEMDSVKKNNKTIYLQPVGINYQNVGKFPDSVSVNFQPAIPAHQYADSLSKLEGGAGHDVARLRGDIERVIQNSVTHLEKATHDEVLLQLEEAKVDFLQPERIAKMLEENSLPEPVEPHPLFSFMYKFYRSFLKTLLILSLLPVYGIWRKLTAGLKEPDFKDTIRFSLAIFLVPIYLLLLFLGLKMFFSWQIAALSIASIVGIQLLYVKF